MEWISAKEKDKLPYKGTWFLVHDGDEFWVCELWDNDEFVESVDRITIYPTHWMPLPEPPKQE